VTRTASFLATGEVAVTGYSLQFPGSDLAARLPVLAPALAGQAPGGDCVPERAHELLGRKGLLGKDAATRLALCAVHRALRLPVRAQRAAGPADPTTAVVASSNLGNLGSVLNVARAVRAGGRREVSPLEVPNASSNVVASTVAIWFRFGGPSLMVCSGATSGLDAVALGMLLLRAGRAARVVVVGTEPADPDAIAVHKLRAGPGAPLLAIAACVVLEPAATAAAAPLIRHVGEWRGRGHRETVPGLAVGPGQRIDLAGACGDMYGAQGVVLVALAAGLAWRRPFVTRQPASQPAAAGDQEAIRVVCGDATDGWRSADITASADLTT
jgi:3-oxoacyl-[acyl-carrier-protein] synthase II